MADSDTSSSTIRLERRERVGVITLHRPEALNALDERLMTEVVAAAVELDRDPDIGAIVIAGSERAFAAGADITRMAEKDFASMHLGRWLSEWDAVAGLRTPTIAAVAGYALGGGCELAMMCDLIVAADTARFGQPEIKLGVIPGLGGTQRLVRAVGKSKAMDLILSGRTMDADEAERSGLVARVVPADELLETAVGLATEIASYSLPALYAAKELVQTAFETGLTEGLRSERRAFYSMFALEDQTEGMAAFREKRAPVFRHR